MSRPDGGSAAGAVAAGNVRVWAGRTLVWSDPFDGVRPDRLLGTSIYTDEPIAAASWDVKLGSLADIQDLGTFRIADRGHLGSGSPLPWVDVAVWSRSEAYALTGVRQVCFRPPTSPSLR